MLGFILRTFFTAIFLTVASVSAALAFGTPEKLVFDLTWTGIKAGTAIQEVVKDTKGVRIISIARSADWISTFYPVEDRIETVLNWVEPPDIGRPLNFRMKLSEGKHRRDKEITFDQKQMKATFINHISGEKATVPISDKTFDPYSCFHFVRTLKLEVGKSVFVDIIDGKKIFPTEVKVLRKEKIRTDLGEFNTIVIQPVLRSEGIFSKKGDMYIWLTDDEKRVPVKMKTKVIIGSVTATLVGGSY